MTRLDFVGTEHEATETFFITVLCRCIYHLSAIHPFPTHWFIITMIRVFQ